MQWLARAVPMGPDGSIGFGVAEHGLVPGLPVSARAFGAHSLPIGDNGNTVLIIHPDDLIKARPLMRWLMLPPGIPPVARNTLAVAMTVTHVGHSDVALPRQPR